MLELTRHAGRYRHHGERQHMVNGWEYRLMKEGEEEQVRNLVLRVFHSSIAPMFSEQGIREFTRYMETEPLRTRSLRDHFVLLALSAGTIAGVIEVRGCRHVSLLFVDEPFQRRGIARELLRLSLEACRADGREPGKITVNSSPNSVQVYERLGFHATGPEQEVNGIRITPMVLELPPRASPPAA